MSSLVTWLGWLPDQLIVILIAALPVIELRGAIPVGVWLLGLPTWEVFLLAMVGNILPLPFIFWLLPPLRRWATHWPVIGPALRWAEERAMKRRHQVETYGFWGLVAFVGVPLPGTGAWTGALVAVLLNMNPWRGFLACSLGVLAAGVLISVLAALGLQMW